MKVISNETLLESYFKAVDLKLDADFFRAIVGGNQEKTADLRTGKIRQNQLKLPLH